MGAKTLAVFRGRLKDTGDVEIIIQYRVKTYKGKYWMEGYNDKFAKWVENKLFYKGGGQYTAYTDNIMELRSEMLTYFDIIE